MENMAHNQAPEHRKIMVHERMGGVRDYLLCEMVSLVYRTKVDTKISGWIRLRRELWDLIHQLPGAEKVSTDPTNA